MSKTRYLQQLGHSWYLRVKVPPELQARVRNTHIRRALGTRDLDEANRRKWPALAHARAYLEALRTSTASQLASVPFPAPVLPQTTTPIAIPTAGLRVHGGLDALSADWAITSALKTVQFQRQQAYKELRAYLGRDCSPEAVTDALAASYVDDRLSQSTDSLSTRRRKLSALRAFWEWMASRRYVPRKANPWQGFRLRNGDADIKPSKRPYTMAELVTLFSGQPTYPALREIMALGLFTGARINELCSLTQGDIAIHRGMALVRIAKSKTGAGVRTIAVVHPIAFGVLKARYRKGAHASDQLFHELKGGGYDKKLS